MSTASPLNCIGLSVALTVLRIKQALVGADYSKPLQVAVGQDCNRQQVLSSLGADAKAINLV